MRTPKKWLMDYLGITQLSADVAALAKSREDHEREITKKLADFLKASDNNRKVVEAELEKCFHESKALSDASYALMKHFNISADIGIHEESWMVISIKGKQDLVYFRNLSGMDVRSIVNFMGQFQGTNRHIDAPRPYTGLFEDIKRNEWPGDEARMI